MATPNAPRLAPRPAPEPRPAGAHVRPGEPGKSGSRLGGVRRGRLQEALRYVFYGPPGVGKSTLAADMESPLFLDIEGGTSEIDLQRYPFRDDPGGHIPQSYEEVTGAIDDLIRNPGHGFKTVVLDGFHKLEAMLHAFICKRDSKSNIEAYGFGKGYKVALVEWRVLLGKLEALRATGVQIAMVGHSLVRTFKNPEGDDYDRYQLMLHEAAAAEIVGWADVVGFVHFEGGASKLAGDDAQKSRARGWSTERRLIELVRSAAVDAKCRLLLSAQLEVGQVNPWRPFAEARLAARSATPESLLSEIRGELDRITGGSLEIEFRTPSGSTTTGAALLALPDLGAAELGRILAGLKATEPVTHVKES